MDALENNGTTFTILAEKLKFLDAARRAPTLTLMQADTEVGSFQFSNRTDFSGQGIFSGMSGRSGYIAVDRSGGHYLEICEGEHLTVQASGIGCLVVAIAGADQVFRWDRTYRGNTTVLCDQNESFARCRWVPTVESACRQIELWETLSSPVRERLLATLVLYGVQLPWYALGTRNISAP